MSDSQPTEDGTADLQPEALPPGGPNMDVPSVSEDQTEIIRYGRYPEFTWTAIFVGWLVLFAKAGRFF